MYLFLLYLLCKNIKSWVSRSRLCSKLNTSEPLDVQTFFSAITESYSGLVQYGTPYTIKNACNSMAAGGPTPIEKLAKYVTSNFGSNCLDVEYSSLVDSYGNTSYNGDEGVITGTICIMKIVR